MIRLSFYVLKLLESHLAKPNITSHYVSHGFGTSRHESKSTIPRSISYKAMIIFT